VCGLPLDVEPQFFIGVLFGTVSAKHGAKE
jgi:hypothetical protein